MNMPGEIDWMGELIATLLIIYVINFIILATVINIKDEDDE